MKNKRKNEGKERLSPIAKAKRKDFFDFSQGFVFWRRKLMIDDCLHLVRRISHAVDVAVHV